MSFFELYKLKCLTKRLVFLFSPVFSLQYGVVSLQMLLTALTLLCQYDADGAFGNDDRRAENSS